MRPILSVAAALLTASAALAQNSLTINTPSNAVVCQPLLISWTGGSAPYFLSVLPGNDPAGQALEDLGQQNGTSLTWTVNIPAGTQIGLTLRDHTGLVAQTASFTVNPGSDSSCVGKAASTSAGSSGTAANTSATPPASGKSNSAASTGTSPATTPAGSGATSAASGTSRGTSGANTATSGTSAASATSTKNAALANAAEIGSVGIFGAALVALLA